MTPPHSSKTYSSSCQISPCCLSAQPLHSNALFHYLVVLDSGFTLAQRLLGPHSVAHGLTPSLLPVIPSTTPACAQCFRVVGEEAMCRHSFPGAPVPRDLHWNSGACVSWHSMARLQPCTEVVSCTALSALCSAYSGARSKPSLRLCRPPLVVARGEERAQPPAANLSHSVQHFPGGPRSPPAAVHPGAAGFPKVRAAGPAHSGTTHTMTAPALFFIRRRKITNPMEKLSLPCTEPVGPRETQVRVLRG